MLRSIARVLLISTIVSCSAKTPETKETPAPAVVAAPQGMPGPIPVTPVVAPVKSNIDPREAALSAAVLRLLERQHLLRKRLDDDVSRSAFALYMDRLDPGKMFLLKSDRDALGKYADKIDDELRSGSLDLAHDGSKAYTSRVAVVEKVVAEILGAPMDHTDEEFVEVDAKKVEPATSEQELRERWRRRLELEVMERVGNMEDRLADAAKPPKDRKAKKVDPGLDKIPKTPDERETKARADLAKSYAARFVRLRTPGPLDAAAELINALTASFDPHTDYLPPAERANFDISMSGSLQGIGAVLREKDDYIEVVDIVPGGASGRQGKLKATDLILSVQQEGQDPIDVVNMHIDDVVHMVRGKKGTVVTLFVQHPSGDKETISITRDDVVVEETYARGAMLTRKGVAGFGYIHLPSFYGGKGKSQRTAAGDVGKLLAEMKTRKARGVIIDIRSNGGGFLGDAIEMTGELIDTGPVVQVQDSQGRKETLGDDRSGTEYDGPVIVLVDHFSASASEILAGALQDYGRAIIVGQGPTTHGKGTVQTLVDLDTATGGKLDLGVLKITIEQFFRISGSSTQREGVTPDIILPDPNGHIESGEKTLEHAIPWSQVPAAPHTAWAGTWSPADLAKHSAQRVTKDPIFGKVTALTTVLKARRAESKIPLQRTTWDAWRKKQIAEIEAVSPKLDTTAPRFSVVAVDEPAKPDERLTKWKENLSRDPWIDECLQVLGEMSK